MKSDLRPSAIKTEKSCISVSFRHCLRALWNIIDTGLHKHPAVNECSASIVFTLSVSSPDEMNHRRHYLPPTFDDWWCWRPHYVWISFCCCWSTVSGFRHTCHICSRSRPGDLCCLPVPECSEHQLRPRRLPVVILSNILKVILLDCIFREAPGSGIPAQEGLKWMRHRFCILKFADFCRHVLSSGMTISSHLENSSEILAFLKLHKASYQKSWAT